MNYASINCVTRTWCCLGSCQSLKVFPWQVDSDGAEIGFGNLVQAIFEFIQSLTEKKKYKAMIRNVLADVVYYLITYLSIPEYQVLWFTHRNGQVTVECFVFWHLDSIQLYGGGVTWYSPNDYTIISSYSNGARLNLKLKFNV